MSHLRGGPLWKLWTFSCLWIPSSAFQTPPIQPLTNGKPEPKQQRKPPSRRRGCGSAPLAEVVVDGHQVDQFSRRSSPRSIVRCPSSLPLGSPPVALHLTFLFGYILSERRSAVCEACVGSRQTEPWKKRVFWRTQWLCPLWIWLLTSPAIPSKVRQNCIYSCDSVEYGWVVRTYPISF